MRRYIVLRTNIIAEWYKLHWGNQLEGQELSEYVAALKKLAGVYLYGTVVDQALWDRNVYDMWNCHLWSLATCKDIHMCEHTHTGYLNIKRLEKEIVIYTFVVTVGIISLKCQTKYAAILEESIFWKYPFKENGRVAPESSCRRQRHVYTLKQCNEIQVCCKSLSSAETVSHKAVSLPSSGYISGYIFSGKLSMVKQVRSRKYNSRWMDTRVMSAAERDICLFDRMQIKNESEWMFEY